MTTVKNIYDYIDRIAPFDTQEEWDNSGHLVGDFRKEVKRAVLALDTTKAVVEFAKDVDADLVISHHPVIFSAIKSIMNDSAVYDLINADIAQISVHTNFDKAEDGINDQLAKMIELENTYKICDDFLVVGDLQDEMSIDDFAEYVSDKLDVSGIRYTDTDKTISKVAVGGGACSEFMFDALKEADCFLTGDLKYHEMLDANEMGYAVISAGHFETENFAFLTIKDKLEKIFTDVEFIVAPRENPIKSI